MAFAGLVRFVGTHESLCAFSLITRSSKQVKARDEWTESSSLIEFSFDARILASLVLLARSFVVY